MVVVMGVWEEDQPLLAAVLGDILEMVVKVLLAEALELMELEAVGVAEATVATPTVLEEAEALVC
jgi:hypothetical protein